QDVPGVHFTRAAQGAAADGPASASRAEDEYAGVRRGPRSQACVGRGRRALLQQPRRAASPRLVWSRVQALQEWKRARLRWRTACVQRLLLALCRAFNASGHPALVMPLGTSKDGLPIGVQLIGPYWSEPELLHIARQLAPLTKGFVAPQGF